MAFIQLPFGVKYDKEKNIKLDAPSNYKLDVLFSQLPYVAHIDHPVFNQRLEDLFKESEGIQKFLLATGDLNDSIQQSINLTVRRFLDPKFPENVMQKPNPVDFVFRYIAKYYYYITV